jgi:hypothetical protein
VEGAGGLRGSFLGALLAVHDRDQSLSQRPAFSRPARRGAFLRASDAWRGSRQLLLVPAEVNTQPAYACYLAEPGETVARPARLLALTVRGDRIGGLTRFHDNDALSRLGLVAAGGVTSAGRASSRRGADRR